MMNKMESIGFRIRRVRALTGLSQEEFAAQVGVSRSVLSQIEIDKIRPSLDVLSAISRLYNVPYNWLIEGGAAPDELKDIGYPAPKIKEDITANQVMLNIEPMPIAEFSRKPLDSFREEDIRSAHKSRNAFNMLKDLDFKNPFQVFNERNDGIITLVPEALFDKYLDYSSQGTLEKKAEKIKLPERTLNARYRYRAFEVPDNRMSPLLEKGDILISYQQNDPRDLVLLSLYVLVLDKKILFGVLTGVTDIHYLISHNPINDYQVEYSKEEIKEFWLVDKVLNDNFTSRFRQAQMMMTQANPSARNIQKG
jgi:transcriptional regulator with XRE-family HTH domain